jgi:hypothetical protein
LTWPSFDCALLDATRPLAGGSAPFRVDTYGVTAVAVVVGGPAYSSIGTGGSGPVPKQKKPAESNRNTAVERREEPRGEVGSMDWETIVLKRVERHVESLSDDASSQSEPRNESGWEEAALLALRRRIRDLKPG